MRKFGYEFDKIDPSIDSEFPEESSYWYSMPHDRTVLAVVRTVTTTLTLIDLLPDLLEDSRVQTVFTIMPRQRDANFEKHMRQLIAEAGVREVPWEEATGKRFDLVITASYEGLLSELSGPILILNHGAGFAKYLALPQDGRVPVREDGSDSTTMVLSHSEQRAYFAAEQDERVSFLVGGDPWRDRLWASSHLRERYRAALGVPDGARLLAVSSTWGEYSLIATNPDLPAKLLSQLACDEYRVALILHPNVWFGHSTWQIRTWLRDAIDAGLVLAPPRDAWRGILVAADVFVGDHGSVMLHAAGLEKPVCFGCEPNDELIDGGPSAELEARAPWLDPYSPLAAQIELVIADHDPAWTRSTLERVFEHPGESHAILRRAIYAQLELDEPDGHPRVPAVDLPQAIHRNVTSHRTQTEIEPDGSVFLARFPAVLTASTPPPPPPANLTSSSKTASETYGSCRVPRSSFVAAPIRPESGVAMPFAKTRVPCSARPWRPRESLSPCVMVKRLPRACLPPARFPSIRHWSRRPYTPWQVQGELTRARSTSSRSGSASGSRSFD